MPDDTLTFRWLGTAGVELRYGNSTVLIDPYFSRTGPLQLLRPVTVPESSPFLSRLPRADAVLVTHSHFDHLLDVPLLCRKLNSVAYGSYNTCSILSSMGVPQEQIREVMVGDRLFVGQFDIEVLQSTHLMFPPFKGKRISAFRGPIKPLQFKMDNVYSYCLRAGPFSLMTDQGALETRKTDVLFVRTTFGPRVLKRMIEQASPKAVIPIHWDFFFKPLSLQSPHVAPRWWLPTLRFNPEAVARLVRNVSPQTRCIVPQPFTTYSTEDIFS